MHRTAWCFAELPTTGSTYSSTGSPPFFPVQDLLPLQDVVLDLDAQQSINALLLADGGGLRLLHCLVGPVMFAMG